MSTPYPACADEDPRLFYVPNIEDGRETPERRAARESEAKSICARCDVKADCLTWAIETRDAHAILGGTTPEERTVLIRRMRRHGEPVPPVTPALVEHGTSAGARAHYRRGESACEACAKAANVRKREQERARRGGAA